MVVGKHAAAMDIVSVLAEVAVVIVMEVMMVGRCGCS
jgi:hypothetical protein